MRLLGAIWLTQFLTALLILSVLGNPGAVQFALTAAIALGIGMLAAIWIRSSLSDRLKIDAAVHKERLAKLSHDFRTELSKQKAEDADRLAALSKATGNSRTGLLRAGIVSGGVLGVLSALMVAQFVGVALLVAAFSGGGAAGYLFSKRVSRSRAVEQPPAALKDPGNMKIIEHQ
jgi:multidrug efflux pump subunit AcrB